MFRPIYFLFLFVFASCVDSKDTKVQRFLMKGNDMASKSNFAEARHYYKEAIRLDSCFADAWNNLGTVEFKQGNYIEALQAYNQALGCRPEFSQVLLNRANTFYELNQSRAAINDLIKYDRLNKDTAQAFFLRGLVYTKSAHYDSAVYYFKRANALDQRNVEIPVNLGAVYYFKGDYDSAEMLLRDAMKMNADEPNIYNTLALVETKRGQYDKAMSWILKALALDNNNPYYINNRGYIYLQMGELDKAVSDIDKSIGDDPYNGWAYRNKGIYYLMTNDPASAIRLLDRALEQDSMVTELYFHLGEAHRKLGDTKKACFYYQDAVRRGEVKAEDYKKYCN